MAVAPSDAAGGRRDEQDHNRGGTGQPRAETASKAEDKDRSNDPSLTAAEFWAVGQAVAGIAVQAWDRIQTVADVPAVNDAPDQRGRQEANLFETITAAIAASPSKARAGTEKDRGRQFAARPSNDALSSAGLFTIKKRYNADTPRRAAGDNDQPPAAGTDAYLKQQIQEINAGQGPGGLSKQSFERREQAVDNLKALGPAAIAAVPALARAAMNERNLYVKRRAIELLGEIGGTRGIVAVGQTLLQPGNDSEISRTAEDSLVKLLESTGGGLTMDDAVFLSEVRRLGNKRVSPAIGKAYAASGITLSAIARETKRRAAIGQAIADARAYAAAEARYAAEEERQNRRAARLARDQAALRALQPESPFGHGSNVKFPDDPKPKVPETRNSYDPNKGGTPQRPNQ